MGPLAQSIGLMPVPSLSPSLLPCPSSPHCSRRELGACLTTTFCLLFTFACMCVVVYMYGILSLLRAHMEAKEGCQVSSVPPHCIPLRQGLSLNLEKWGSKPQ